MCPTFWKQHPLLVTVGQTLFNKKVGHLDEKLPQQWKDIYIMLVLVLKLSVICFLMIFIEEKTKTLLDYTPSMHSKTFSK